MKGCLVRHRHRHRLTLALLALVPFTLRAQTATTVEPKTAAGAYATAVALRKLNPGTPSDMQFAPDSATMYRDFVRCRDVNGASRCALIDDKHITVVSVRLHAADSAWVTVGEYWMISGSCPLNTPYPFPKIAATAVESFGMAYRDGRWRTTGVGRIVEC